MNKAVKTSLAPKPVGTYSQAIVAGDFLFSTQMGISPATDKLAGDDIESQTRQTMENFKNILQEAGMDLGNVVKATIFLKNIEDFAKVNQIYSSYFQDNPPARGTVEVSRLPIGGLIEIEIIACRS